MLGKWRKRRNLAMRGSIVLSTIAVSAWAQSVTVASGARPGAPIPAGVPLRVELEHRVAIRHSGDRIEGRLVEPVYVFDQKILPAGSLVEGHIAKIGGVPAGRRVEAILSGNFTPARDVQSRFDTLVLSDGSRLPLRTAPSRGTTHNVRIAARKKHAGTKLTPGNAHGTSTEDDSGAVRAFRAPGRASRLKSTLLGRLPYHRQTWGAGTLFSAVLQEPLTAPAPSRTEAQTDLSAATKFEDQKVHARLLHAIDSRTARRGALVEAEVTRPLFSKDHRLLIPQGSLLHGEIVDAKAARRFHRNGKLAFVFRQLQVPGNAERSIQGYLDSAEADFDAHLALDSEGGVRASSPKSRFLFPAIAVAAAGLSFHQDVNAQGVPDQDIAGRAESGAVGLGLIGTLVAQTSRTVASSIAFTGAAYSVYHTFLARGEDVVLPENSPVEVSLKAHGDATRR